jgi:hypothetical protein
VQNARVRADDVIQLFCGILPVETPYFATSGLELLPWIQEYSAAVGTGRVRVPSNEFLHFAKVVHLDEDYADDIPQLASTYLSDCLCTSPRFITQGLAFEALYCFDRHIDCLVRYQHIPAMAWLEAANANHIEAMAQAQAILRTKERLDSANDSA